MPSERQCSPDPVQDARIRLLSAAIAQRILAIPSDVSPRGRRVRIANVRQKVGDWFSDQMTRTVIWSSACSVILHDEIERDRWHRAFRQAWGRVMNALNAGEDLTTFLFPREEPAGEVAA